MLYQRLIPSLLLRQGRLVKGERFGDHRDAGGPATTARAHNHQSADELFVLDIYASKQHRGPDVAAIRKIADECFMPLTVGGGISNIEIAKNCMEAGADKLCLTATACDNPELIGEIAHIFGAQAVVIGIDVLRDEEGECRLYDHRSRDIIPDSSPFEYAKFAVSQGAGEIKLMAVDREGTRSGYDLELYSQMFETVDVPIVLEGGAGSLQDIEAAFNAGVSGVSVGALLVFADNNLVKIKQHLISHGCNVRV